jgi:hypothetical protein
VEKSKEEQAADTAIKQTEQRLRRAGLSRTYTYNKLKLLCEATKPISCIRGKEADGGTVDFVDVPDNRVQLDAVKTVIGMYGDVAPDKHVVDLKQPLIVEVVRFGKAKNPK